MRAPYRSFAPAALRKLLKVEGLLELGLLSRACELLEELETEPRGAELLEPTRLFYKGDVLYRLGHYEEAIVPLQQAARSLPPSLADRAWRRLADCREALGQAELADYARTHDRRLRESREQRSSDR